MKSCMKARKTIRSSLCGSCAIFREFMGFKVITFIQTRTRPPALEHQDAGPSAGGRPLIWTV